MKELTFLIGAFINFFPTFSVLGIELPRPNMQPIVSNLRLVSWPQLKECEVAIQRGEETESRNSFFKYSDSVEKPKV